MDSLFVKQYGLESIQAEVEKNNCIIDYCEKALKISNTAVITDKIGLGLECKTAAVAKNLITTLFDCPEEQQYITKLEQKLQRNNYDIKKTAFLYGKELHDYVWRKEIYLRYKIKGDESYIRALSIDLDTLEESDYFTITTSGEDYLDSIKDYFTKEQYLLLRHIIKHSNFKNESHIIKTDKRYEVSIYFTTQVLFETLKDYFIKLLLITYNIDISNIISDYSNFPYLSLFSIHKEYHKDMKICLYFRNNPN
jgi:hypothetical protein